MGSVRAATASRYMLATIPASVRGLGIGLVKASSWGKKRGTSMAGARTSVWGPRSHSSRFATPGIENEKSGGRQEVRRRKQPARQSNRTELSQAQGEVIPTSRRRRAGASPIMNRTKNQEKSAARNGNRPQNVEGRQQGVSPRQSVRARHKSHVRIVSKPCWTRGGPPPRRRHRFSAGRLANESTRCGRMRQRLRRQGNRRILDSWQDWRVQLPLCAYAPLMSVGGDVSSGHLEGFCGEWKRIEHG